MRSWKVSTILTLAAALGAWGCGSSSSSGGVTITISPTTASVITNRTQVFSGVVTGSSNTAVTWTLACATGVTANTCGSIDANGLYTAPATLPTIPATTSGGTPTIAPTVTITATAQADTKKSATATLTIVTGISITITPTNATVGTKETFPFSAVVNNPGCNITSSPTCENVTWSLPTPPAATTACPNPNAGTIGSTTGVYTAPSTVPCPSSTVIVTATSVADTSVTATASVNVVTATVPTVTLVSPNKTALGGLFQDVYITGTNFISTENVFVNGSQLASNFVTDVSTSIIRARIPDFILAVPPPSGVLQIGVAEQTGNGGTQTCTNASSCQIAVVGVRPGVVGPSPDSIPQGTGGVQNFNVDGGFFGVGANPAVTATYNGQLRAIQPPTDTTKRTRQLQVTIGGASNPSDFGVPGLYAVAIKNATDSTKMAVANLAVQPNYNSGSSITPVVTLTSANGIGTSPSDVAINPATGMAVVANTGSNSISLIDLTASTPTVVNLCTFDKNISPPCPTSGPTSVAVDYVRNRALVVNSTSKSIAVVDLGSNGNPPAVTSKISLNLNSVLTAAADTPGAVGINPVTGRALVAMQQKNYGILVDLGPPDNPLNPPVIAGVVSISTGQKTRVAVEPHLNWAIATPGGQGSVGIVDLNQQSTNTITSVSRTSNVVQVTVQQDATTPPLAIQLGDAVLIQNASALVNGSLDATTLNGVFTVTAIGPTSAQFSYTQTGSSQPDFASTPSGGTISYSQPVSIVGLALGNQGIAINTETQQAVLVDPTTGGVVTFFSLIDQSVSTPLTMKTGGVADKNGPTAVAYNPLTNTIVAVDPVSGALSVIDPTAPRRLNDSNLSFGLDGPVAVAVDPGTNLAVVANQTNNTVSILSLGAIKPFSITETNPKTFVTNSSINSLPNPNSGTLTVIGKGLTCTNGSTNLSVRLDGVGLSTICAGNGDRELTATVGPDKLTSARRYALDVVDASGNVTNAEDLTVEQSVDLSSTACTAPEPSGVAIDPQQNLAIVSMFGCGSVALIDMAKGNVSTVKVGSNPMGVAVIPRLQWFVVANKGSGNATILDEGGNIKNTITTGSGSMGAAADEAAGEFAIANSLANTVTVVNAATFGASSISTGLGPTAVAFNYVNHQVAVAATGGNSLGISGGTGGSVSQTFSVAVPTSVIYDPVPTDCGSNNNGTTTNTTGCFIVNSSTNNSVNIVDPVNSAQTGFRMGINPTAIAYNYLTSTLVSTNSASRTVSVADLLGQKIRAVLTLPPAAPGNSNLAISLAIAGALQYALDIQPFTNVAVVADTANGRVLFVPLPR